MLRAEVHVFHTSVFEAAMRFASVGIAPATPMKKTTLELVHGLSNLVVPVYGVVGVVGNSEFSLVSSMLNPVLL